MKYAITILIIGNIILGTWLYFTTESNKRLEVDLTHLNNSIDRMVDKRVNDAKQIAIDSMQVILDNRPKVKKPDTVFINIIKYEKSKNAILDSASIYQYNWSNRKLDSIYSD